MLSRTEEVSALGESFQFSSNVDYGQFRLAFGGLLHGTHLIASTNSMIGMTQSWATEIQYEVHRTFPVHTSMASEHLPNPLASFGSVFAGCL